MIDVRPIIDQIAEIETNWNEEMAQKWSERIEEKYGTYVAPIDVYNSVKYIRDQCGYCGTGNDPNVICKSCYDSMDRQYCECDMEDNVFVQDHGCCEYCFYL